MIGPIVTRTTIALRILKAVIAVEPSPALAAVLRRDYNELSANRDWHAFDAEIFHFARMGLLEWI